MNNKWERILYSCIVLNFEFERNEIKKLLRFRGKLNERMMLVICCCW